MCYFILNNILINNIKLGGKDNNRRIMTIVVVFSLFVFLSDWSSVFEFLIIEYFVTLTQTKYIKCFGTFYVSIENASAEYVDIILY